jgi:hypothetical protein
MSRRSAIRFAVGAFIVVALTGATNSVRAQNINNLLTIFGGDKQRAPTQAQAEWRRLSAAETNCIDQRLRHKGSSVEALIREGVKPSAARLVELRSGCREFVHHLQAGSAPALARDATGSQRPAIAARGPSEPKDVNATSSAEPPKDSGMASTAEPSKNSDVTSSVESSKNSDVVSSAGSKDSDMAFSEPPKDSDVTPPAEPPKDSEVTPSAASPKNSDVTPPAESPKGLSETLTSEQPVGEAAEELVQQVTLEPKISVPERGIRKSESVALLFAVAAIAALFAIVMHLFVKWRNKIQSTS